MDRLEINLTPENICPYCGAESNRAMGAGEAKPGDIVVCIRCYSISTFNNSLMLRRLTAEEFVDIRNDSETWNEIQKYRRALKETEPDEKN